MQLACELQTVESTGRDAAGTGNSNKSVMVTYESRVDSVWRAVVD